MTERLYEGAPLRVAADARFRARLVRAEPDAAGARVVLDRTLFYPTGGGQPTDLGQLGGVEVLEVVEEGEEVVHRLADPAAAAWEAGRELEGQVDLARRRDHMQQHSGQHLLSALLIQRLGVETLSFHLGAEEATIDVAADSLESARVAEVERAVNAAIQADHPVRAEVFLGEVAEAEALSLRKAPDEKALRSPRGLRVVTLTGEDEPLDRDACCGTHVARLGELGSLVILGWERSRKGQTRLRFAVGGRATRAVRERLDALSAACQALTTGHRDLPARTLGLLEQAKEARKELDRLAKQAALAAGESLGRQDAADEARFRVARCEGAAGALKAFAGAYVAAHPAGAIVAYHAGERLSLAVAKGEQAPSELDAGALLRELLTPLGGKGGGPASFAQGAAPDARQAKQLAARAAELLAQRLS